MVMYPWRSANPKNDIVCAERIILMWACEQDTVNSSGACDVPEWRALCGRGRPPPTQADLTGGGTHQPNLRQPLERERGVEHKMGGRTCCLKRALLAGVAAHEKLQKLVSGACAHRGGVGGQRHGSVGGGRPPLCKNPVQSPACGPGQPEPRRSRNTARRHGRVRQETHQSPRCRSRQCPSQCR